MAILTNRVIYFTYIKYCIWIICIWILLMCKTHFSLPCVKDNDRILPSFHSRRFTNCIVKLIVHLLSFSRRRVNAKKGVPSIEDKLLYIRTRRMHLEKVVPQWGCERWYETMGREKKSGIFTLCLTRFSSRIPWHKSSRLRKIHVWLAKTVKDFFIPFQPNLRFKGFSDLILAQRIWKFQVRIYAPILYSTPIRTITSKIYTYHLIFLNEDILVPSAMRISSYLRNSPSRVVCLHKFTYVNARRAYHLHIQVYLC